MNNKRIYPTTGSMGGYFTVVQDKSSSDDELDSIEKLKRENEELKDVLSNLSSYVGCGLGDDTVAPKQWEERIREGINDADGVWKIQLKSLSENLRTIWNCIPIKFLGCDEKCRVPRDGELGHVSSLDAVRSLVNDWNRLRLENKRYEEDQAGWVDVCNAWAERCGDVEKELTTAQHSVEVFTKNKSKVMPIINAAKEAANEYNTTGAIATKWRALVEAVDAHGRIYDEMDGEKLKAECELLKAEVERLKAANESKYVSGFKAGAMVAKDESRAEVERLKGLLKTRIDLWQSRCMAIEDERDVMRPVVDAAWNVSDGNCSIAHLRYALDTYRASRDAKPPHKPCGCPGGPVEHMVRCGETKPTITIEEALFRARGFWAHGTGTLDSLEASIRGDAMWQRDGAKRPADKVLPSPPDGAPPYVNDLQTVRKLANDLAAIVSQQCPDTWAEISEGVFAILGVVVPGDESYLKAKPQDAMLPTDAPGGITNHVTNTDGECVSWCPACGPECEHGNNSFECKECKLPPPEAAPDVVWCWNDSVSGNNVWSGDSAFDDGETTEYLSRAHHDRLVREALERAADTAVEWLMDEYTQGQRSYEDRTYDSLRAAILGDEE